MHPCSIYKQTVRFSITRMNEHGVGEFGGSSSHRVERECCVSRLSRKTGLGQRKQEWKYIFSPRKQQP